MSNRVALIDRSVTVGLIGALVLVGVFGIAAHAQTGEREITRVDRKATPTEPAQYPSDMVVKGDGAFDGSYNND